MVASQGEHDLADVNDFGRPVADDVDSQQLERVRIENQFQHALFVAQHLALGQFCVAGQSDFVGSLLRVSCSSVYPTMEISGMV